MNTCQESKDRDEIVPKPAPEKKDHQPREDCKGEDLILRHSLVFVSALSRQITPRHEGWHCPRLGFEPLEIDEDLK